MIQSDSSSRRGFLKACVGAMGCGTIDSEDNSTGEDNRLASKAHALDGIVEKRRDLPPAQNHVEELFLVKGDRHRHSRVVYKSDGKSWASAEITLASKSQVVEVARISDLRSLSRDRNAAFVRGPGGKAGLFVRREKDPFGNGDDESVVLRSDSGDWWIRQAALSRSEVSVLWWGAMRDGETNDAPAIQAAINWANSEGADIRVPAGTYRIGSQLSFADTTGLVFRGAGTKTAGAEAGTIFIVTDTDPLFDCSSVNGLTVEGIRTKSETSVGTITEWDLSEAGHVTFRDCALQASTGLAVDLDKALFINFENCQFNGGKHQIRGKNGDYSNVVNITGCNFVGGADSYRILNPGEAWTIINCNFQPTKKNTAKAIRTEPGEEFFGFTILGCGFYDATNSGSIWLRLRGQNLDISSCKVTQLTGSPASEVWIQSSEDSEREKYLSGVTIQSNSFDGFVDCSGFRNSLIAANRQGEGSEPFRFVPEDANVALIGNHNTPARMGAEESLETSRDASEVEVTYGSEEQGVIQNNRTRIDEIEQALRSVGLLA